MAAGVATVGGAPGGGGVTPLSTHQLEQLKQAHLVVDDRRTAPAAAFMVLGAAAEGLRPIVAGPGFPLRPLPINYTVRCRPQAAPNCSEVLTATAAVPDLDDASKDMLRSVSVSHLQLHRYDDNRTETQLHQTHHALVLGPTFHAAVCRSLERC